MKPVLVNGAVRYVPIAAPVAMRRRPLSNVVTQGHIDEDSEDDSHHSPAAGAGHTLAPRSQLASLALRYRWLVVPACIAALLLAAGAAGPQYGVLLLIFAGFVAIFTNLGRRQGGLSAYSIFNKGFQSLQGTLRADDIDREIRGGVGGLAREERNQGGGGVGRLVGGAGPGAAGRLAARGIPVGGGDDDVGGGPDDDAAEDRDLAEALRRSLTDR